MAFTKIKGGRIAAVVTCVPREKFDNLKDTTEFTKEEVRKVVAMAGVNSRRVSGDDICSSDLCLEAAEKALNVLQWKRDSIDALIMVTQTPDYFMPPTSCIIHEKLNLSDTCAAFDMNLGCSGYPYGLWLAFMMLNNNGFKRVLLLHGDTPSRYAEKSDRSVSLLFGDAGSATALEAVEPESSKEFYFGLHSDGAGSNDMIIQGGGFRERFCEDNRKYFVKMNGANVFNFTIKRLPELIEETFNGSGLSKDQIDYFIFHQSNRFIIKHIMKKMKLEDEKIPLTLKEFGNTGGPSIPLTITQGGLNRPNDRALTMMLLGYGVGLSWGSALIYLDPDTVIEHSDLGNGRKTEK